MPKKIKPLSERLAELTNPEPVFVDPEDDVHTETRAQVVEEDEEDDVHEILGRSQLRNKNVPLLDDQDQRYLGKKVSRRDLDGEQDDCQNVDENEHALAELGHMFEGLDEDVDDDDSGTDNEDEENDDGDATDGDDSSDEDNDEEAGEDEVTEDANNKVPSNGFTFEDDGNFGKYGDYEDDECPSNGSDDDSIDSDGEDIDQGENGPGEDDDDDEEQSEAESEDGIKQIGGQSVEDEIEKGRAVKQQLAIYDKLLENRILVQKVLVKVNRFPQHQDWANFVQQGDEEYQCKLKECQKAVKILLSQFLELEELCQSGGETSQPPKKKMKLKDFGEHLAETNERSEAFTSETIQKWNDRTRVAAGNVSKKSFSSFETSTLKQIEQIMANKSRLIERTRVKRSVYDVLGKRKADVEEGAEELREKDAEIFDDDDFYHQLLRELIERKTSSSVDDSSQLGRQWLEIQKLRSRLKRKVDTRATKGRKVRYDIHSKLVNFMAPIYTTTMNDEAKNELFSSLFGKRSAPET